MIEQKVMFEPKTCSTAISQAERELAEIAKIQQELTQLLGDIRARKSFVRDCRKALKEARRMRRKK